MSKIDEMVKEFIEKHVVRIEPFTKKLKREMRADILEIIGEARKEEQCNPKQN